MKNSGMRMAALSAALASVGMMASCGGYSSGGGQGGGGGLTATITNSVTSLQTGATYTFTATTPSSYGYTSGITWSISPASGAGTLSNPTNSGYTSTVTYQAPSTAPNPDSVTITATPSDMHVGPAKDTFMITASAAAMLEGQFAFELSGFDSSGETVAAAGSLAADGGGKVTGGSMDLNRNRAPSVHISGVTGTYTLGSNLEGRISLAVAPGSAGPLAFSFILTPDRQSGVITGSDSSAPAVTGLMLRQDRAASSLSRISGPFVFKLESNSTDRFATVGKLTIGNNALLSGIADASRSGLDPLFDAAPLTGRLTAPPDAQGRGTFTLATATEEAPFVFYVASDAQLLLLETSARDPQRTRQIGQAERQALPFSGTTLNAAAELRGSGFDTQASSFGLVSVRGSLAVQNLSQATVSWNAVSSNAAVAIDSQRSDLLTFDPATGRGTVQLVNGYANNFADSLAFYLASPGRGFFLDKTAGRFNRAIAGDLEPVGAAPTK